MTKRIVVALGGNAILTDTPTAEAQIEALKYTSEKLVGLIKQGYQLIISHGNGPQVGNLLLQQQAGNSVDNPALPLDTLVAMTQGSIGYWLQNTLREKLMAEKLEKQVVSIVTQVVVEKEDPAFDTLTKPIGPFLSKEIAQKASEETGDTYIEDAGRGYRKVVASPKPKTIIEYPIINQMIENDVVTISAGGGGIPVIETEEGYRGVEAVIDKDFASGKLAELVQADYFLILTGVDNVYINFNQPDQEKLEEVTVSQLKGWISKNQFAPGSMLPKIEAAITFVENSQNGIAIITSLEKVNAFFEGGSATVVVKD